MNSLEPDNPLAKPLGDVQPETVNWRPTSRAAWGDREFWREKLEVVALGYLELESQGREVEYDLNRLMNIPV
ncbi:hypothetical protein BDV19DRAFT_352249 [Aspergillus venezuelensis]